MPEEAPAEQVEDDASSGETPPGEERGDDQVKRDKLDEAGADEPQRQTTGNPDNAG